MENIESESAYQSAATAFRSGSTVDEKGRSTEPRYDENGSSSSLGFKSRMGIQEHMKAINLRTQRTICCYLTYVLMICLAIMVILWEITSLHGRPNHWLHIVMEGIISMFLLGEIFVFTIAMGTRYFANLIHVADLVITIGCAAVFVGLLVDEMVESFEWPEEWELSILLVRYGLMAGRLMCLCYRSGRSQEIRNVSHVRFSRLASSADPDLNEDNSTHQSTSLLSHRSRSDDYMVSMPHPKSRAMMSWTSQ